MAKSTKPINAEALPDVAPESEELQIAVPNQAPVLNEPNPEPVQVGHPSRDFHTPLS